MHWFEVARDQPKLAEFGRQRLLQPGVVLVGTVRRDGTARISPVEPFVMDGDLWLSMMWGSRKAQDLARDPRVLVHSIITGRDGGDGEYKVRGVVRVEDDADVQRQYADAVGASLGWCPEPGQFHLFAVDIADITVIRYVDATGDQFVTRWPPGSEFVRRATSATAVGAPEPHHDLLRS